MDRSSPHPPSFAPAAGQLYSAACLAAALAATLILDPLSSVLLVLSTFLFFIVCRYSARYMAGDPGHARFTFWLCATGTFVFAIILVQNLLLFALAWSATSLSLHQLLQFYRHRPGALFAARKKYLISRLGDLALFAAIALVYAQFHTGDFASIFAAAAKLQAAGPLPPGLSWAAALLVLAALLKSAQFPFHSWLPDTMETPTPVSALMHAGIINAGGILVIRLSPLVSLSETALAILTVIGGFTALFASIVMLTQASVKRALAFSTVAQMGFMMFECGLGAFHLALVHIVAHSLYKAHAFLSTGGAVLDGRPKSRLAPPLPVVALALPAPPGIGPPALPTLHLGPAVNPVLTGVFAVALAQMLWTLWAPAGNAWRIPLGLALGAVATLAYLGLELLAARAVAPLPASTTWIGAPFLLALLLVAVAQSRPHWPAHSPLAARLFVHARNGFYLNTLANRVVGALWPVRIQQENF